jgi:phosphinothricin acetyltransferase
MQLRLARRSDVPAIQAIYNHAVLTGTASYDEREQPDSARYAWFDDHAASGMPVYVALDGSRLIGWGALGPFRPRPAYRFTAEDSIYVVDDWHSRGVGSALLGRLIDDARAMRLRTLIAVIGDDANTGSIRLHARLGFVEVARLRDVGFKFGRWLTQVWMQRHLTSP